MYRACNLQYFVKLIIIIRRANTEDATFDHEGNVANYRGAKTDHRRTIDFGLWQAGLLRYVGQDPHYVVMGMVRATRHGKQRFPGRRRRHTPRSRSGCLSRPGRSPNHEDRARECQVLLVPHREGVGLAVARRPSTPRAGVAAAT